MTLARKIFSASVPLLGANAVSMASLMNSSILHWWENDDGTPSMDASNGSEASVTPSGTLWVGSTSDVFDVNADPKYAGVPLVANQNYSLQDFGHGLIDPNQIWFYAPGDRTLYLVFQGY